MFLFFSYSAEYEVGLLESKALVQGNHDIRTVFEETNTELPARETCRGSCLSTLSTSISRCSFNPILILCPIEDPMVSWNEDVSPFRKVATIVIPPQSFDTAAQLEFGESLSYSPWHSLTEHSPLGGINRSRKRVYEVISEFRHERNGIPQVEPAPGFTLTSLRKRNASEG